MTELTKVNSRAEDDMFAGGYETWNRVRQERDVLQTQCLNWERSHAIIQSENEMLRQRVLDLEHKSSFYMRHSTELTANLSNCLDILKVSVTKAGEYVSGGLGLLEIQKIIETTLRRAKDAAYRPSNSVPQRPQPQVAADDGEPAPKFLTATDRAAETAVQQAVEDITKFSDASEDEKEARAQDKHRAIKESRLTER